MLKAVARTCVDCTTQLNNAIKKEIYQKLEADSGIYLSKDAQLLASTFFLLLSLFSENFHVICPLVHNVDVKAMSLTLCNQEDT